MKSFKSKKMNVEGKVYKIGDIEQISAKFKKREIVIKTEGDYPQFIGCQLTQDKCTLGDLLTIGQQVNASINLRGREWVSPKDGQVKFFNTIEIWKIDAEEMGSPQGGIDRNFQEDAIQSNQPDDLPF
tara:strand:+ start:70 stop:453 length:384 start_codon:yes stop_codon:yes gene_type:complete